MVFPLVIHSDMYVTFKHLFISIACLSWMKVNFLNQFSWPGVFLFCTFLSVALSESRCILASGPSTSPHKLYLFVSLLVYLLCPLGQHPFFPSYINFKKKIVCLFVCFDMSTFVCYLMPNPFLYK